MDVRRNFRLEESRRSARVHARRRARPLRRGSPDEARARRPGRGEALSLDASGVLRTWPAHESLRCQAGWHKGPCPAPASQLRCEGASFASWRSSRSSAKARLDGGVGDRERARHAGGGTRRYEDWSSPCPRGRRPRSCARRRGECSPTAISSVASSASAGWALCTRRRTRWRAASAPSRS